MGIMQRYVDSLNRSNPADMASLFDEDCLFIDSAPRLIVGGDVTIRGRTGLQDFFSRLFNEHRTTAALVVDMGKRALYNVTIDNHVLRCICHLEMKDGHIARMEIRNR